MKRNITEEVEFWINRSGKISMAQCRQCGWWVIGGEEASINERVTRHCNFKHVGLVVIG